VLRVALCVVQRGGRKLINGNWNYVTHLCIVYCILVLVMS